MQKNFPRPLEGAFLIKCIIIINIGGDTRRGAFPAIVHYFYKNINIFMQKISVTEPFDF